MALKDSIRELLIDLRLDLTKNLEYDRLTRIILKKSLKSHHNCIDIGCHKGEILDLMLTYAPEGKHYGFEPIPSLFETLATKYRKVATIYPYALSDQSGTTQFNFVKNAPAYSGIKERKYDVKHPEIEKIEVQVKTLDDVIPQEHPIHFIKIDVEGGEFGVLKGARQILKRYHPIVLFECGKGGSDYYGTEPSALYEFMNKEVDLKIYTLKSFIKKEPPLNSNQFINHFESNKEYYFVAAP